MASIPKYLEEFLREHGWELVKSVKIEFTEPISLNDDDEAQTYYFAKEAYSGVSFPTVWTDEEWGHIYEKNEWKKILEEFELEDYYNEFVIKKKATLHKPEETKPRPNDGGKE